MDLLDLIGDSRTDSLPAGFLRSVKIKYKQERSCVFPPGAAYNKNPCNEDPYNKECQKRAGSAASTQSTPSFMSWKIPPRLMHNTQLPQTPFPDMERAVLNSRASVTCRALVGSQKLPVSQEKLDGHSRKMLPRLCSSGLAMSVASEKPHHESLPAVGNRLHGINWHERRAANQIPGKDLKNCEKSVNLNATEAVNRWMQNSTDKEQAIALKFFSSLSAAKAEEMGTHGVKQQHSHTQGDCEICDTERTEETLQTLTRDGPVMPQRKLQYNPRRKPDLSRQSHYHIPKHLPPHVRQQFQTWHHLPIYTVPRDAPINKSAMFTQPHRDYGRHFSIHPEWGLHKPLVLKNVHRS